MADREACTTGERRSVRTEDEFIKDGAMLILTWETILITFYSLAGSAYLAVKPMVGKVNVLKSHLLKGCQYIPADVKIEVNRKVKEDDVQKTAPLTPQSSFSSLTQSLPTEHEYTRGPKQRKSSPSRNQGQFEGDLCDWFVACGVPWNAANSNSDLFFEVAF